MFCVKYLPKQVHLAVRFALAHSERANPISFMCSTGSFWLTADPVFPARWPQALRRAQAFGPGVSDKVLIQQLKDLEADRVLARTDYKEVPPRVDQTLTPLGRSLVEAIAPLCTWGTENAAEMASIFAKRDTLVKTKLHWLLLELPSSDRCW